MSLSRQTGKNLIKSVGLYENVEALVKRAVDKDKPSLVKSLSKNREKLDEAFENVFIDFKAFKRDINVSDEEFNAIENEIPNFEYNDGWFTQTQKSYYELVELSDEVLEKLDKVAVDNTAKDVESDKSQLDQSRLFKQLESQVASMSKSITDSIEKLSVEVNKMVDNSENIAKIGAFKKDLFAIEEKIDGRLQSLYFQYIRMLDENDVSQKTLEKENFVNTEKAKICSLLVALNSKVKDDPPPSSRAFDKKEQTHLKKIDPPLFKGDIIDYSDFKRKWKAHVSKAGLTEESELDRLRDNVPEQAAKSLYGETTMLGAWSVLDKLYGDKDLIANKLKMQLKNIKAKGKNDPDIVIDLVTEVNNIALRLKTMKMEQVLQVDNEFLAAVFRALPSMSQQEWLKFDKSSYQYKWDAFVKFLDQARDQALQTKVLLSSYEDNSSEDSIHQCKSCNKEHPKNKKCSAKINNGKITVDDNDKKKLKKQKREECGKCPLCSKYHTFTRRNDKEEWPTDRFFKCDKFQGMSVKERAEVLEKHQACPKCTSWNHVKGDCKSQRKCGNMVQGQKCQKDHSMLVCGSTSAYCGSARVKYSSKSKCSSDSEESSSVSEDETDLHAEALLLFQDIAVSGCEDARVCWDDGSNRALVTHDYAKRNKLESEPVVFKIDVPTHEPGKPQNGVRYSFTLINNNGEKRKIWGFGVDKIMQKSEAVDLRPVRKVFPHIPKAVFDAQTDKEVDLLIGTLFLGLHPSGGEGRDSVGDLRALHSQYGHGWVIAGAHPLLKPIPNSLTQSASIMAKINKCEIAPQFLPSFWEGESQGVLPPKRCNKCLNCSQCSDPAQIHSIKEQAELLELQKNTVLKDDGIHVNYVFSKDPNCLPNNRNRVVKMAASQEAKLQKSGHLEFYNQELMKYIERGAVVKLSEEELNEWSGPINYISHHGVEKDSPTTPLRIVTNSSLNNGGNSLNGCLIKGPNSLNPMLDIALRFRCHECGLVFDLSKAYNSLKTGSVEKHLRRLVWRFSPEEEWQDFAFDCVHFGDLPASNFLEIGRDLVAEKGKVIDLEAALKIIRDSYVDDEVTGGTKEAVDRMKGEKLEDGTYSGTMTQILNIGKLKIKSIVSSGEKDEEAKALLGNTVFGYTWEATSDVMCTTFPIYIENKKRKTRFSQSLTEEEIKELSSIKLTKRMCLGMTNSFKDFLGIGSPFILRFKLLMKQLFESTKGQSKLEWDDEIESTQLECWLKLIAEAVESGGLFFPRAVRPENAIGNPSIVGFGDGSFVAFCAVIYLRWLVKCSHENVSSCTGDYVSRLLWAKTKVTPTTGLSIPRVELTSGVEVTRMEKTTVKALQCDDSMKPTDVYTLLDSKCTISVVEKTTSSLKPYFHNRVCEIIENMTDMKKVCNVEELHYVASADNPADIGTRDGVKLCDLGPESVWQRGPSFLCLRRDLWPTTRDFISDDSIPKEEVRTKLTFSDHLRANIGNLKLTHPKDPAFVNEDKTEGPQFWITLNEILEYSNSIEKVRNILALVIKGWKKRANSEVLDKNTIGQPNAEELKVADRLILMSAMPLTAQAFYENKLTSLCPKKEGQLIVTTGRLGEKSLSRLLGVSSLPILLPNTRAAYLHMVRAHTGGDDSVHKSITETLARSRESVWIVRARQLAKKVCSQCYHCQRQRKKLLGQRMAKLKEESLTVCRPWTYVSIDFAGPIIVKGTVNSRARKKIWIIVYVCRSTKAVCLLACHGYDTESFLLRHEEFVSRHGAPSQIVSDRGTQLVSASQVLAEKISPGKWDWDRITKENCASSWKFVPIGSQHHNGLSESTVKVLKKSISNTLHPGVILNFPELVTLLARISYSINARPLGLSSISDTSQQEDVMLPITPNMLLLGRSSDVSPPLEYSEDARFCKRLAYISELEQEWWSRWYKQVLPTLFTYKRWKRKQDNLQVGDVVMLYYPGHFKDDYTLARVVEVHPDDENLVRKVTIKYRKKNPKESPEVCKSKKMIEEKVAVHRLQRLDLADEALSD